MEIYDVVKKLIGPITPVGEEHTDRPREMNLEAHIELVDKLIGDLSKIADNAERHEASMKRIGEKALFFLDDLYDALDDDLH